MQKAAIDDIATRFFAAVEGSDLNAITAHYHPDVQIWHSRDQADTDLGQNEDLLRMFCARVPDRRYEILRRDVFDGGFVQEHVVHGTRQDGTQIRLPAGFLCHIDAHGLIRRIANFCDNGKSPLGDVVQQNAPKLEESASATTEQIDTLANRFFGAVERGDIDSFIACYHPDARIWHTRDEADTDIAQNREAEELFISRVSNRRFELLHRHVFDGGFVQEHVVHGIRPDGSIVRLPVLFIAHLDEQARFKRIAEHFDPTRSPLQGLVQRHIPGGV